MSGSIEVEINRGGLSAGALSAHLESADPHPQYRLRSDPAPGGPGLEVFRQESTLYVRKGIRASDTNDGTSDAEPLLTIGEAARRAMPFTTVDISAGIYKNEILPIRWRRNIQVRGAGVRQTLIGGAPGYEFTDIFKVDSGFKCNEVSFVGHQADATRQAWAISFNELADNSDIGAIGLGAYILKSPYLQNCSSYTAEDDSGEAGSQSTGSTGGGMLVDGNACAVNTPIRSMVVDSFTQVNLAGPGCLVKNDGFVQLVSFFATFCSYHVRAESGGRFVLSGGGTSDFGTSALQADGYSPRPIFTAKSKNAVYGALRLEEAVTFDLGNQLILVSVPGVINLGDIVTFKASSGNLPGLNPAISYTVISSGLTASAFRVSATGVGGPAVTLAGGTPGGFTVIREGASTIDVYDVSANRISRQLKYPTTGSLGSTGRPVTIIGTSGTPPDISFTVQLDTVSGIRHEYVAGGTIRRGSTDFPVTSCLYNNQTGETIISAAGFTPSIGDSITLSGLSFICDSASRPSPGMLMFPQLVFPSAGATSFTYTRVNARTFTYLAPAAPLGPTHEYVSGGSAVISGINRLIQNCVYDKATGQVTVTTKNDIPAGAIGTVTMEGLRFICEESRYAVQSSIPIDINSATVPNNSPNKAGYRVQFFSDTNRGLRHPLAVNQVLDFRNRSQGLAPSHTMEWVGSGTNYDALPENGGLPVRGSEIIQTKGGKIFYSSINEVGDVDFGGVFKVDGTTGELTVTAPTFNLGNVNAIGPFSRNGGLSTVGEQLREVSSNPDLIASTGSRDGTTVPTQLAVFNFTGSRFLSGVVPQAGTPLSITGVPVQDGAGNWSFVRTISVLVGTTPGTVAAGDALAGKADRVAGRVPNSQLPVWIEASVTYGQGLVAAANQGAARTLLGLGNSSTRDVGTTPGTVAAGDALAGKADLVGGVVPTSQIPSIALVEYLGSVANQAAMLALRGQGGDWCIRTDTATEWVIVANNGATLSDWVQLPTGIAPVSSINGQTGAVVLGTGNLSETGGNLFFTAARAIAAALAGFTPGAGTVGPSDSILQAIQKLAAGTFQALEATTTFRLPSAAPGSPLARHLYPNGDTLRYRDSANVERLLLSSADNLANLGDLTAARTNLGVIDALMAGFAASLGAITASDSIRSAIQKLWGNSNSSVTLVITANATTIDAGAGSGRKYRLTTTTTSDLTININNLPTGSGEWEAELMLTSTAVPPTITWNGVVPYYYPGLNFGVYPLVAGRMTRIGLAKQVNGRVTIKVNPPEVIS